MRLHKVYKHQDKGYFSVKVGFAWYGFFFNILWLLFKRLFWRSFLIIIFAIYTLKSFFIDIDSMTTWKQYSVLDVVLALGVLSMPLIVGLYGNKWVSKNLEKKGYLFIQTIPSPSTQVAISQTENEKSTRKPTYAAWGRQDSYQPGHPNIEKEK